MRSRFLSVIGFIILLSGWVSGPCLAAVPAPAGDTKSLSADPAASGKEAPAAAPASKGPDDALSDEYTDDENRDYEDEPFAEEQVTIADPIEPFNRAMNQVNDKMYFWLLKPAAQGYKAVVPEPARISVKNFFFNLRFPVRFVSCVLQTDFKGAAAETGRFVINTVWGIGGLMDPASSPELALEKQDTDLGQTLGVYGVGHGFYIVWPFFGPSSPRDSVDLIGNQVLYPLSFLNIWYASFITKPVEVINTTSFRIGDYEALIGAAIDPYVAIRNAYIQYRMKDVKARKAKSLLFQNGDGASPAADAPPKS
ncbi:MAG: VacJ family lipoprotein [Deltaproteobacteria bacterium]|nr:VacJ family lipoprotein [Deltaproteobacteria bacterium]